jgi:hypothetical protein
MFRNSTLITFTHSENRPGRRRENCGFYLRWYQRLIHPTARTEFSCVVFWDAVSVWDYRPSKSRAIAQVVSRRFPTAAGRYRAQISSCGICGGQSGSGVRISPSASVSSANSHSTDCSTLIMSSGAGKNRPLCGRRTKWTQSHPTPRN